MRDGELRESLHLAVRYRPEKLDIEGIALLGQNLAKEAGVSSNENEFFKPIHESKRPMRLFLAYAIPCH